MVVELPSDIAASLIGLGGEQPPGEGGAAAGAAAAGAAAGAPAAVDDATLTANIAKALRPTGSETPEQVEANATRLLAEKEKFIGGQAQKLGDTRKLAEAMAKTYLPLFDVDAEGKPTRLSIKNIGNALGQEEVARQLAEQGLKLVPIHEGGADGASFMRTIREQVADSLVPGKELKPAEKIATLRSQMETDPDLAEKFNDAVEAAKWDYQLNEAAKAQADRTRKQAEQQRIQREHETALAEFEKLPHKETLRTPMLAWAKKLDGQPLAGALRIEVLRKLAEAETLKLRVEQSIKAGFKLGLERGRGIAAGSLPAGGAPSAVTMAGGGGGGGLPINPEQARKAFA